MRKIILFSVMLIGNLTIAQISTGPISLTDSYSVQIDINETDVEITLEGDENRWMGLGLGVSSMTSGEDVITFDSSGFNDRTFMGIGVPPVLDTQDWTVVSNDVASGVRTLVVNRPLNGSDASDFSFDPNASSLDIVWANGTSLDFQNHGSANRGITTIQFTLGVTDIIAQTISIFPVPAKDLVTVSLQNFEFKKGATISVYNSLGSRVIVQEIDHKSSIVDINSLAKGVYVIKINSGTNIITSRFIKE